MALVPALFVASSSSYIAFSTNSHCYPYLHSSQAASRPLPKLFPPSPPRFLPPTLPKNPGGFLPPLRTRSQLNNAERTSPEGESVLDLSRSFDCDCSSDLEAPTVGPRPRTVVGKSGSITYCPLCCRRHALGLLGAILSSDANRLAQAYFDEYDQKKVAEAIHPARPGWYEEFYAMLMQCGMKSYEAQIAGYKAELFNSLDENAQRVLELGIGTGPNIKYYANRPHLNIIGVDPNSHMEKYAQAAASAAGLPDSQFNFVQGVGEALPVATSSVDAVICTLVLCSVTDVGATLKEIHRVLKPGGSFFFLEHVAAPEGSSTRFWQNLLDPVQQFVADGCHLTRNTLGSIQQANFASVDAQNINVPNLSVFSSQIVGIAQT